MCPRPKGQIVCVCKRLAGVGCGHTVLLLLVEREHEDAFGRVVDDGSAGLDESLVGEGAKVCGEAMRHAGELVLGDYAEGADGG